MKCPKCDSLYTLLIEELNVVVLFKCSDCGQNSLYVAGHVIALNDDMIDEGPEGEKQRHIIETLQVFACEFAGNVLKNVNRVINVNVDVEFGEGGREDVLVQDAELEPETTLPETQIQPSVRWPDAPTIRSGEIRDFVRIDLNLIDNMWYFDKVFGDSGR
jgi:hypothetical protein